MKCGKCNREVESNIKFCPYCGANLMEVPSSGVDTPNQPQPVTGYEQTPEQNTNQPVYGYGQTPEQNTNQPVTGYEQTLEQNTNQAVSGYEQRPEQNTNQVVSGYEQTPEQSASQPVTGYGQIPEQNQEESIPYWERKPEKMNKRKLLIPGILLALVLVVGCVGFAMKDTLKNMYQKQFASPSEYYQYVEETNRDEKVEKICDSYEQYCKRYEDGYSQSGSVKVEFGDQLKKTISSLGLDAGKLDSVTLNAATNTKKSILDTVCGLQINDSNLITAKLYADYQNYKMYMQIPELSDTYIDASSAFDSYSEENKELLSSIMENISSWLPAADSLKKSMVTYTDILFEGSDEISKSSATFTASGVSQKCTKLTITYDEAAIKNMAEKMLKAAKEDELINDLLKKIDEIAGTSNNVSDYTQSMEEAIKEIESMEATDIDGTVDMDVYVDEDGTIIGRVINIVSEEEKVTFTFGKAVADGKIGVEYKATVGGLDTLVFEGSGDYKNNAVTGDFAFIISEEDEESITVNVSAKDYKTSEDGNVSGTLSFSTDKLPGASLDVTFTSEKSTKAIKFGVIYGGVEWGTITLQTSSADDVESANPGKDATLCDMNDEEQLQTYSQEAMTNAYTLLERLEELTGISQDEWSSLFSMTESFGEDEYDDYDYEEDYDDYDDYYDYEDEYNYEDDYLDDEYDYDSGLYYDDYSDDSDDADYDLNWDSEDIYSDDYDTY